MDTKLGKVETYCEELSPKKFHSSLQTWSREVMWQIKIIKSPISQGLFHQTCPFVLYLHFNFLFQIIVSI